MMLEGSFYRIENEQIEGGTGLFTICFDAAHSIFKGHFPGQPVVPGVTMSQLSKELMEKMLGQHLVYATLDSIKFIQVIDPTKNSEVQVKLIMLEKEPGLWRLESTITANDTTFFKLKGSLRPYQAGS